MIGANGNKLYEARLKGRLGGLLRRTTNRLNAFVERHTAFDETCMVTLTPPGQPRPERWALVSYLIEPFMLPAGTPVPNSHTNQWESLQMARTLTDLGFGVDVISYRNRTFRPRRKYSVFIGARTNFERLAGLLPASCVKIAHLDTAHWIVNNANAFERARAVKTRRNQAVDLPRKLVEPNWAIESADFVTILGNEFTEETYRYAGKPIHRLPLPSCETFEWPADKDFDRARRRFVWFGSDGLVHKGLDLALEAFAGLPGFELVVCGPVAEDRRFADAFRRELYELPNIRTVDWVDIASEQFKGITRASLGVVYPSCSEGGGGSVITCLQAGLIPVVTRESSVDVDSSFGVLLPDASIESIRAAVVGLADLPTLELEAMARNAWSTARERYTRERYAQTLKRVLGRILGEERVEAAPATVAMRVPQLSN